MKLIRSWIISAFALFVASWLMPDTFLLEGTGTALMASLVLGILNSTVRPVLNILTFPLTLITLGLFRFVVNGIVIKLLDGIMDGMEVKTFLTAMAISLIISLISNLFEDTKKRSK